MTDQDFKKYFKRALISNLLFWGTMTYMVIYFVFTDQMFGTTITGEIPVTSSRGLMEWLGILSGVGGIAAILLAGAIAIASWIDLIVGTVVHLFDLAAGKLWDKRS